MEAMQKPTNHEPFPSQPYRHYKRPSNANSQPYLNPKRNTHRWSNDHEKQRIVPSLRVYGVAGGFVFAVGVIKYAGA